MRGAPGTHLMVWLISRRAEAPAAAIHALPGVNSVFLLPLSFWLDLRAASVAPASPSPWPSSLRVLSVCGGAAESREEPPRVTL